MACLQGGAVGELRGQRSRVSQPLMPLSPLRLCSPGPPKRSKMKAPPHLVTDGQDTTRRASNAFLSKPRKGKEAPGKGLEGVQAVPTNCKKEVRGGDAPSRDHGKVWPGSETLG